ncbi:MAG: DUF1611 domain-containing protein [Candidatus Diapherotrites archaeon]|nr:DUF1611 domain-containing protein [Candidatus Diapherotrites archaeon]
MQDNDAVVFCEGRFKTLEGKTAHGLIRHSNRFNIVGVIDRTCSGDAGEALDGTPRGIPFYGSLEDFLSKGRKARYFVIGAATDGGQLPDEYKPIIAKAIRNGMSIVNGLHIFLSEDPEFASLAAENGVRLVDVRKPPDEHHFFTGRIETVGAARIAVLGTDSAVGKRTTAVALVQALRRKGLKAELIGTGQTSWMQGLTDYCVCMDSLVNNFVAGEIEHAALCAWDEKKPDIIVFEGQGSITHPAYPGGFEILAAGRPHGIVLQHPPARKLLDGFQYPMPDIGREIKVLEMLSEKPVIAVTINHENMTREEVEVVKRDYAARLGKPAFDVLWGDADALAECIVQHLEREKHWSAKVGNARPF